MADAEESVKVPSLPRSASIAQLQLLNPKLGVQDLLSWLSSLRSYQSGVLWRQNNSRLNPRHASASALHAKFSHLRCFTFLLYMAVWAARASGLNAFQQCSLFYHRNISFLWQIRKTGKTTRRASSSRTEPNWTKVWRAGPVESFHHVFKATLVISSVALWFLYDWLFRIMSVCVATVWEKKCPLTQFLKWNRERWKVSVLAWFTVTLCSVYIYCCESRRKSNTYHVCTAKFISDAKAMHTYSHVCVCYMLWNQHISIRWEIVYSE